MVLANYYLGRIVKGGILTEDSLVDALTSPHFIFLREYAWTVTDFTAHMSSEGERFFFGRLTKFQPEGQIQQVDPVAHSQVGAEVTNYVVASSPFVYVPRFSGIAYQHIWNKIEQRTFVRRFRDIVLATRQHLFVECWIEPIPEYEEFRRKVEAMDVVNRINGRVEPPNPLFGRYWRSLRDYLHRRGLGELRHDEHAASEEGVRSSLRQLLADDGESDDESASVPVDMGDAVVLMAAAGYGVASVHGVDGSRSVIARTSDTIQSFRHPREPEPAALHADARTVFESVNERAHLGHATDEADD